MLNTTSVRVRSMAITLTTSVTGRAMSMASGVIMNPSSDRLDWSGTAALEVADGLDNLHDAVLLRTGQRSSSYLSPQDGLLVDRQKGQAAAVYVDGTRQRLATFAFAETISFVVNYRDDSF